MKQVKDNVIGVGETNNFTRADASSFNPKHQYEFLNYQYDLGENNEYQAVVEALENYGMDKENIGTENWNPLKDLISPNDDVVIKPNLVLHRLSQDIDYEVLLTSPGVLRAILDFVSLNLAEDKIITIADAPLQSAKIGVLLRDSGILRMVKEFTNLTQRKVRIVDLRKEISTVTKTKQLIKNEVNGDPKGYVRVDLTTSSEHKEIEAFSDKMRVSDYSSERMMRNHNIGKHAYLISKTILSADVVINVPKLKTHKYAGMTGALKNLVGINCHKDSLPHFRKGSVPEGGDQYQHPSARKQIISNLYDLRNENDINYQILGPAVLGINKVIKTTKKLIDFEDPYFGGKWHGNDTIHRTIIDLNKIFYYADESGNLHKTPVRKTFTFVDAVMAGQGYGPLEPTPYQLNKVLVSSNNLALDTLGSRLLGIPFEILKTLKTGFEIPEDLKLADFNYEDIEVYYKNQKKSIFYFSGDATPPEGWDNY